MQRSFIQTLIVAFFAIGAAPTVLAQVPVSGSNNTASTQGLSVDWGARIEDGTRQGRSNADKAQDPIREAFDPSKPALGEPELCVVLRGSVRPECATVQPGQEIILSSALFDGPSGDEETTCRRVADRRPGPDGKPVRVWLDVCDGDEGPQTRLRSGAVLAEDVIVAPEASNLGDSLEVIVPSETP